MPTESNQWISVARVARFVGEGRYHLTVGGDGLASLHLPAQLSVFPPGTDPEGESTESADQRPAGVVTLTDLVMKGAYGRARIESESELGKGAILAVRASELHRTAEPGEVFWFEIRGLPVYTSAAGLTVGTVTALTESGAHGILEVTTAEGTVLVPFADKFVTIDLTARRVDIPDLDDFRT